MVCNTVVPESDENGEISYQGPSPDEIAFVENAADNDHVLFNRKINSIKCLVRDKVHRYKIKDILDFTSDRKRMSVIVEDEEGNIILYSKGADDIMLPRLNMETSEHIIENTKTHINQFSELGLRTLILGYKPLTESEYKSFKKLYTKAGNHVGKDRDKKVYTNNRLISERESNE